MTIPENVILHTILVRPYVFLFLAAYLVLSISSWGWRRSFAFLLFGYLIAWASEAASIRTGFPYGWYFYRYENLEGEWLNAGVPVWDSLSYVFLCYAGLELAAVILRHKPKDLARKLRPINITKYHDQGALRLYHNQFQANHFLRGRNE